MLDILKDKKFIFFDVGYTLDKPANGNYLFTNKFYEVTKGKIEKYSKEECIKGMIAGLNYSSQHVLCLSVEEEIDGFKHFYQNVSDEMGLDLTKEEIEEIAIDRACNMKNYTPMDNLHEIFETLKPHFEMGVISDTWPSIVELLKYLGVYDYFKCFTYSCDLGVFKPDKRMFIDALNKCGYDAKDTVFIDDTPANLDAAKEMGITPIWIATNPMVKTEAPYTKIYSLDELIK